MPGGSGNGGTCWYWWWKTTRSTSGWPPKKSCGTGVSQVCPWRATAPRRSTWPAAPETRRHSDGPLHAGAERLDATQQLKADPVLSGIPVVACTAHAMTGDAEKVFPPVAMATSVSRIRPMNWWAPSAGCSDNYRHEEGGGPSGPPPTRSFRANYLPFSLPSRICMITGLSPPWLFFQMGSPSGATRSHGYRQGPGSCRSARRSGYTAGSRCRRGPAWSRWPSGPPHGEGRLGVGGIGSFSLKSMAPTALVVIFIGKPIPTSFLAMML